MPKERMGKDEKRGSCTDMVFSKGIMLNHFFTVALRPNAGHGLLMLEISKLRTTTHHTR